MLALTVSFATAQLSQVSTGQPRFGSFRRLCGRSQSRHLTFIGDPGATQGGAGMPFRLRPHIRQFCLDACHQRRSDSMDGRLTTGDGKLVTVWICNLLCIVFGLQLHAPSPPWNGTPLWHTPFINIITGLFVDRSGVSHPFALNSPGYTSTRG